MLYSEVTTMDDSPECRIDVSMIISRAQAKKNAIKPECDHDAFPVCEAMVDGGIKTCK